jgi:hypothetical protein
VVATRPMRQHKCRSFTMNFIIEFDSVNPCHRHNPDLLAAIYASALNFGRVLSAQLYHPEHCLVAWIDRHSKGLADTDKGLAFAEVTGSSR